MWKRSGRAFLITGSVAASSSSSSAVAAPLRPGSCGLYPQPLSSPVLRPTFLALLRLVEAPSSVGAAPRMSSWGCSSSYSPTGEFPNRGGEAEVRGQPTAAAVSTCWNCGTSPPSPSSEPFLVCGVCRSVQPVDEFVDYFQIFGLEKKYELGTDNLESKYKDWQKKLHPDLVHTKSEQERSYAAEQSARVIDAYRTLSKPLSRALYLLKLDGLHVDEEKTISDPELLAEVMEIREAVEEANDSRALEQIKSELQEKLQNWSNSFGKAFKDRNFEDAVTSIQRMTYYERAIQETVKKL